MDDLMRFTKWLRVLPLNLALLLWAAIPVAGQHDRTITRLAGGVYEIQHEPNGNTTVIIGERQVFVVDSCFLPSRRAKTFPRYESGRISPSVSC